MKKHELDPQIESRFHQVYWSIYLYNTSLTELQIISDYSYNNNELEIVNSYTFNFYRVTSQYCFVMEYSKLLETGRSDKNQHISSLFQLNKVLDSSNGGSFREVFSDNEARLLQLRKSAFYNKVRGLRDKKFAHSDKGEINRPFEIKELRSEDFQEGFNQLHSIKEILDICTSIHDFEFSIQIPCRDGTTENFIRFSAECREYYFKNFTTIKA